MGRVALDLSISLDGFVAGTDPGLRGRFGDGGEALHSWAGVDRTPRDELMLSTNAQRTGAILIGRRTYDFVTTSPRWWTMFGHHVPEPPLFVLASTPPPEVPLDSCTFVTAGLEAALARSQDAAQGKDVVVMGGANVARQCLAAELLDELRLHVTPVLLGTGTPLFTKDIGPIALVQTESIASRAATHLTYRFR